jgi:hypothetical protein
VILYARQSKPFLQGAGLLARAGQWYIVLKGILDRHRPRRPVRNYFIQCRYRGRARAAAHHIGRSDVRARANQELADSRLSVFQVRQFLSRNLCDSRQASDGQWQQKRVYLVGLDDKESIRFAPIRGDFCQELVSRNARRGCQIQFLAELTDRACHKGSRRQPRLVRSDIEVCFVERQWLDQVCVTLEDLPHVTRHCPRAREIRSEEDGVGTQPVCAHCWHGGAPARNSWPRMKPRKRQNDCPAKQQSRACHAVVDGRAARPTRKMLHVDVDDFSHHQFATTLFRAPE